MATEAHASAPVQDAEEYQYLERRDHPWRKQLYIKGRNMTVAHLVYTMRANKMTPEEAAADFELPRAQIEEALFYYERHRDVVEGDQDEEKRRLKARGIDVDAPPVSR
jgi:uncharacterized protein (DUF433 family)